MDPHWNLNMAEGLAAIGLYEDAWDAIEDLPPEEKASPRVLRARLACCIGLNTWEMGGEIASVLADGYREEDKDDAATFWIAYAGELSNQRLLEEAREAITRAIQASPKIRETLLDDERFDWIFDSPG